ncbi:putative nuclease of putative toxin-antitoxin system [Parabacteroides sp. PF5-5]|uniref:DUF5615 family PIN-like protein n=1 Tax=unclassified Parabacteroides TaxID=2649774 RepID=UPI00247332CF|nr:MULTISPECIES: DUF5615 family PIN-like protein [unclassified Parabacteroides]MDH6303931.1 putative nuclease of putative toxin-antitoxin system [Parabacteroides sp. PH5-39]MDH6314548.1 putative nuclease of putative toxin-antitoxin system [Parabacteroides sp. PF5-13]MDH6318387.1 putative nuclease of putative toxin-antitoxin system [Parabacteroides sp. PH5-13]MDH6322320.1 putative nuclease of putative toxin-antitoxin system [Parabacteroides sp. PH5-8]MDH6325600.1 putative nuclease of putative t
MNIHLLLDANISWRSVSILQQSFDGCSHVDSIGLKVPAKDKDIWEYARKHDMVIVSNDEDFLNLLLIKGFPPKIILLKTGNQRRDRTEKLLIDAKKQIEDFINSSEYGLLEIV